MDDDIHTILIQRAGKQPEIIWTRQPHAFAVGDLVSRFRNDRWLPPGAIGVIRSLTSYSAGVEWAAFHNGHDLGGLTRQPDAGWWVKLTEIEPA